MEANKEVGSTVKAKPLEKEQVYGDRGQKKVRQPVQPIFILSGEVEEPKDVVGDRVRKYRNREIT